MAETTQRKPRARKTTTPPATTAQPEPVEQLASVDKPRPTSLTPDVLRELRRPFTVEAIRFKPQTVTKDKQKAMATFYIDARLVAERLNAIVGPENWSDEYTCLFADQAAAHAGFYFPVECRLTIFGVTKVDVGVYQKSKGDPLALKSSYSDALKRAAVKFGIGAYLYGLPKAWAPTKTYGSGDNVKVDGFSPAGESQLKQTYTHAIAKRKAEWGDPLDHGDVGDDPDTQPEAEAESSSAPAEPTPPKAAERETKSDPPKPQPIVNHDGEQLVKRTYLADGKPDPERDAITLFCLRARDTGVFTEDDIRAEVKAELDYNRQQGYRQSWLNDQTATLDELEKAAA